MPAADSLFTLDVLGHGLAPAPGSGTHGQEPRAGRTSDAVRSGVGGVFPCIVADPPWDLKMGKSRTLNGPMTRGKWNDQTYPTKHIKDLAYPTMSVAEICALKVPAAKDAHCYIWTINRYVEDTYDVARAWGFEPSTLLFWLKQPMGLGLGGAFVPCVEPILFCRRGKLAPKRRCDRNWWGWPRGPHSAKPEEFQSIVESVSPGPYLEMFARRTRPGWSVWGNQVTSDVELRAGGGGAEQEANNGTCEAQSGAGSPSDANSGAAR